MSFTAVKPVVTAGKATSGIRFGLKRSARDKTRQAILSMNAPGVLKAFGGIDVSGKHFSIGVGRGQDHGFLEIRLDETGACQARNLIAGSIMFRLQPWDILPEGEFPAQECTIHDTSEGRAILRLPQWAQARQKAANGVTLA